MLWRIALILAASLSPAAVLPEKFGGWTRSGPAAAIPPATSAAWSEYGFLAAESAVYSSGSRKLELSVHRMKDSTGGLAAWQALRPAGSSPSKLAPMAAATPTGHVILIGNYVAGFGGRPTPQDIADLRKALPKVDGSSLPTLPGYLPRDERIPASERYVLGPESLAQVMPEIPASAARFDLGAEAQFARYRTQKGEHRLLILSYPTPQIARLQRDAFATVAGLVVHRAGPLVALAPVADGAQQLLESVAYSPSLMWNEQPVKPQGNPGDMLLAIVTLAGVLIAASVLFGLAFGGYRIIGARFGIQTAERGLTTLHLSDR